MNSRRLMCFLKPRITPYHIVEKAALCITANLAANVSDGSWLCIHTVGVRLGLSSRPGACPLLRAWRKSRHSLGMSVKCEATSPFHATGPLM
jgi:hypothetical protein